MKYGQTFGDLYDEILSRLKNEDFAVRQGDTEYPEWWNGTITLYNKYIDDENRRVIWYRHVLSGCYIGTKDVRSVNGSEITLANTTVIRVPYSQIYIAHDSWDKSDARDDHITFRVGDIIVKGECETEIDENKSGSRSNDVISNNSENAFVIKLFADNTNVSPRHYRIEG